MMARVSHAEEVDHASWSVARVGLDSALQDARGGDEEAFRLLYRRFQPRLLRYVRTLVGDEAEDVASEAWLRIAKDLAAFDGDIEGFRAWTATIARHRALDHLRRRKRRPVEHPPAAELFLTLAAREDTETTALESLSTEAAMALIARLPAEQAEVIVLRVVVGLEATAVARIMGKRPGAVRTAAHRGLRRLQQLLNDLEDPR
jgi:RNA polymerase sigma-70 factor, ECF subfamily